MKNFGRVIKEINRTLSFLIVFETTLNAVVFFLIVYFFLSLVNLYPLLAIIPAAVFFIARIYTHSKLDKRKIVENKYEPLKEKLRTAADNPDEENEVVEELQSEVLRDLKQVGISSFISTRKIAYKLLATVFLSFAIVLMTTFNLYVVDLNKFLGEIPDLIESLNADKKRFAEVGAVNESEDIYGESKLAVLGNEQIDIRIKPVNFEVSVRDTGSVEEKQFDEMFPSDINVEQASSYEEDIPEEQQELVKNYFNKVANR
ncbi:hypothetical protein ISS07_04605 [Candidatus Woesearchaeota archaeon]|nr:hypothetical protein [Candidatus Woesearchaeota archaeon]